MSKSILTRYSYEAAKSSIHREPAHRIGAVTATQEFPLLPAGSSDLWLEKLSLVVDTTHAAHAANYWTFDIINKGSDGLGVASLFSTPPTTQVDPLTGYVAFELTPDQNQEVALGDLLSIKITKAAAAVSLSGLVVFPTYRSDV